MVATEPARDLIGASLEGDQEAFESLIREHQRMIHSLCYRMTGSLADADDLAQETFIHAYQHLADFRSESGFSSWLYRIAMNQCLNWRKQSDRRARLHQDWGEEELSVSGGNAEQAGQVHEALMALSPKERAAIVLTVYEGLNHAEAARALQCSETTVSWRVFMARGKLKKILKQTKE